MANQRSSPGAADSDSRGSNLSGLTDPVWYADSTDRVTYTPPSSLRVDVCVVGAGIAGLTSAYLLAKEGRRVAVIDEKPVAGGESGRTSAHLASVLDDRFAHMERMHGLEAAALMHKSHAAAIDLIERIDRDEKLQSGFARLDAYLLLAEGQERSILEEEFAAAQRAGVEGVELLERHGARGVREQVCLRFSNQARFEPLAYVRGLAEALNRMGVPIVQGVRVKDLKGDGPVEATLSSGHVVSADAGVAATNIPTPISNWMGVYTKEASYRTYMIGLEAPADAVTDALYWDFADPYHYVRLHRVGGRMVLLVGGEDHKTGQPPRVGEDPFRNLEGWARMWFPTAGAMVSRWSGQVNEPDDGAAFIGRVPTSGHKGCYVITGDSGMGLTHGTLGAVIVRDLILGRENPWAAVYDPARKPLKSVESAREFVKENVNAAAQLKDYVTAGEASSIDEVARGEGVVIREGVKKVAVYRDEGGEVHRCSAICPHLKCVVRWNGVEKSWDCPCHGSRFDAKGKLINGPSIDDLSPA